MAAETVVLEGAKPLLPLSHINRGDTIADPPLGKLLDPVRQNQPLGHLDLRNIVLRGPATVL